MTEKGNNQSNPEYEAFYTTNGSVFSTNKWHVRRWKKSLGKAVADRKRRQRSNDQVQTPRGCRFQQALWKKAFGDKWGQSQYRQGIR